MTRPREFDKIEKLSRESGGSEANLENDTEEEKRKRGEAREAELRGVRKE